jgi:hypothetical protein
MALGPDFFERDEQGCAGGVELAFMSATPDRNVAMGYAGAADVEAGKDPSKDLPTLYVIVVGKTAIGAKIAELSQFRGEIEYVYPPLTLLELVSEPELSPDGKFSKIYLRLTVNQRSTTVEDAEQARRRFLVRHVNSLLWSLRNWARQHHGLVQRLGPQIAGVQQRMLDEVQGAELAVSTPTRATARCSSASCALGRRRSDRMLSRRCGGTASKRRRPAAQSSRSDALRKPLTLPANFVPIPRKCATAWWRWDVLRCC